MEDDENSLTKQQLHGFYIKQGIFRAITDNGGYINTGIDFHSILIGGNASDGKSILTTFISDRWYVRIINKDTLTIAANIYVEGGYTYLYQS